MSWLGFKREPRLHYWETVWELESGNKIKVCGLAEKPRTATIMARRRIIKEWAQDPETMTIIVLKRLGPVDFGV